MRRKLPEPEPVYITKATPTLHIYMSAQGGVTLLDHWPNGHPRAIEHHSLEQFCALLKDPKRATEPAHA